MPYSTTTLTSASTNTSVPVALSWLGGKATTASVVGTSQSSGAFVIQYSMDDVLRVPSSLAAWFGYSSAIGSPGTVFVASAIYPDGVLASFATPIAALRLFSSATNNVNNGPITLRVIQGEIA